jgi:general secretion pathway protein I
MSLQYPNSATFRHLHTALCHLRICLRHPRIRLRHPRASGDLTTTLDHTDTSNSQAGRSLEPCHHCRIPACAGMTKIEIGAAGKSTVRFECREMDSRISVSRRRTVSNIRRSFKRKYAFTLIEVMVALLVITLGMGAVIVTTGESGWKSSHLRESTIASWVAYNEIALFRAKRSWSDASSRSGDAEMANAEWDWQMKISKTDDPSLRRVDVEVSLKGETAVKARVTGFIARL